MSNVPDPPPTALDPEETLLLDELRVVIQRRSLAPVDGAGDADDLIGTSVGPYQIRRLLGEGGMARVYEAIDGRDQQHVACKILKPAYAHDAALRTRFEREARNMARLQHPHVVRILDFPAEGRAAIVMELLAGGNLRGRLEAARRRGQLIPAELGVALIVQAAEGVAAAHRLGIIHRDLKPSNLLLRDRAHLKVADFGTVLVSEGTTWLTGLGQQIGTPGYMSPEQCRGERVSPASDVYALGATLFEVLTGRLPFEVEESSPFALMLKHISEPVPDPRTWRPGLSGALCELILRSLAKRPDDRFTDAEQFVTALRSVPVMESSSAAADDLAELGLNIDLSAVRRQLERLPQRAIVCWACRCARRVQHLNPDPRVENALSLAEGMYGESRPQGSPVSLSRALSHIRTLWAASLKAAYTQESARGSPVNAEAAKAAAAASASATAVCIADTAADAVFAARSALRALHLAGEPVRSFWETAQQDYQRLLHAGLGQEGTVGHPVPATLFAADPRPAPPR